MKKKYIIIASAIVIASTLFISPGGKNDSQVYNDRSPKKDIVVVLDPGHGGEDGGAVSESGVIESDLNLKYALKLKQILNLNGFKTVLTRKDRGDLSDKSISTVSGRKKSDMYKRLEIYNSDVKNVAISIHQNMYPAVSCTGSQVFYATRIPTGKTLADNITKSIVTQLQRDNLRESKPTNGNIFLLDNATVPAVIVECGFLSNNNETKRLCDINYQKKLSYCIFLGFMNTDF